MIIRDVWWTETVIINLKREGVPDFDKIIRIEHNLIDKKYLELRLELLKKIVEKEEDACQKER